MADITIPEPFDITYAEHYVVVISYAVAEYFRTINE